MTHGLPRRLIGLLAVLAVASFGLSAYMEERHLGYLQMHPIMANLISAATGFCFGSLSNMESAARRLERAVPMRVF